jgi:hypothetical protein
MYQKRVQVQVFSSVYYLTEEIQEQTINRPGALQNDSGACPLTYLLGPL